MVETILKVKKICGLQDTGMGIDKKVPNSRRYEKEVKRPKTADRFEDLGYLPAEQLPTPREALGGGGAGIEGKN